MHGTARLFAFVLLATTIAIGCGKKKEKQKTAPTTEGQPGAGAAPAPELIGVDMAKKVVYVGALNDESGPAAVIGKPFANGKRLVAARVNAGGSGLLPDGWTIKLIEKDHAYNSQKAVQHYAAIKKDVLFLTTSFGTPNTLPLRKHLERDNMLAFPASLSSQMAEHEHTPPAGASYAVEARRAMDWLVEKAGDPAAIKAGVVYQDDDYGKDGLAGWRAAAKLHGVQIVAEKTVTAGQKDATAVVSALKEAGATHVLLTILPTSTLPILGQSRQLKYAPTWIGNTAAWIDGFFVPEVMPPDDVKNFYIASSLPFWGEERKGMAEFLDTWEKHGKDMGPPNWYILMSYTAALVQMQALKVAIESGDLSRAGFKKAFRSLKNADADGLVEPLDFTKFPYESGTKARIMGLDLERKTFTVQAPFATPRTAPATPEAK